VERHDTESRDLPHASSPSAAPGPVPASATTVFGPTLPLAERFVEHLATTGTAWGLIGPREVPRLWDRHVLNCAVMTDVIDEGARVVDIGSGAGLPGLTLALRRPDLTVVLVEPLLRRSTWLEQVVADLGLLNVSVRRARAEELHGVERADYVTARAVAPLDRLAQWGLPLLRARGRLLALKGRTAEEEIARTAAAVTAAGGVATELITVGMGVIDPPVTVVQVVVGDEPVGTRPAARRRGRPRAGRRAPAH
jgi:16S rRNA (guanine527-N7)-methyltransferase